MMGSIGLWNSLGRRCRLGCSRRRMGGSRCRGFGCPFGCPLLRGIGCSLCNSLELEYMTIQMWIYTNIKK